MTARCAREDEELAGAIDAMANANLEWTTIPLGTIQDNSSELSGASTAPALDESDEWPRLEPNVETMSIASEARMGSAWQGSKSTLAAVLTNLNPPAVGHFVVATSNGGGGIILCQMAVRWVLD